MNPEPASAGGTRRRVPPLWGSDPYKTRTQGLLAPHHAQNRRVMGTPQSRPGLTSVSPSGLSLRQVACQPGVLRCGRCLRTSPARRDEIGKPMVSAVVVVV